MIANHDNCSPARAPLFPRLQVVCAWCRSTIREGDPQRVSHGICPECAFTFRTQRGKGIREMMQGTDVPYIVVDGDAVVIDANDVALAALKKTRSEISGQRGGVVIACERSSSPAGCGHAKHCDACLFRNTILQTFRDGQPRFGVVSEHPVMGSGGEALFRLRFSTSKTDHGVVIAMEPLPTSTPSPT